jgi:hypothetical protein
VLISESMRHQSVHNTIRTTLFKFDCTGISMNQKLGHSLLFDSFGFEKVLKPLPPRCCSAAKRAIPFEFER